ncbi:transcriptional regulator [Enterococcus florum]|uniref:Transcriptional regulator n=1 Tax=Enterococcus florum TaxID=2480627 RepID=A0A4P5P479_9ENTE|nr:helix-turn-helix domain-containing protein [Enterococcus florum]GCF92216.1 transcriptional regulator [Enterococcus florum]
MDIHHLLDKSTALQVSMVEYLYHEGGRASINELMAVFQLSLPTIQELVETFQLSYEDKNELICIVQNESTVVLETMQYFDSKRLLREQVRKSLAYRLLLEHLEDSDRDIYHFTFKFQISEEQYVEEVSRLNRLLTEFELSLENGQIVGDELQIRYFFFQLLWVTQSYENSVTELTTEQMVIRQLEKTFQRSFSTEVHQKIALYLEIFSKRRKKRGIFYAEITPEEEATISPEVLKLIKEALAIYSERYALTIETFELKSFYFFLCTINIFSSRDDISYLIYEQNYEEATLIDQMNDLVFTYLRKHGFFDQESNRALWMEVTSLMFSLHFNVLKYSGWIEGYDAENHQITTEFDAHARAIAKEVRLFAAIFRKNVLPEQVFIDGYKNVLLLIQKRKNKKIKIGISFTRESESNQTFEGIVSSFFQENEAVEIGAYLADHSYDLVINDHVMPKDPIVDRYITVPEIPTEFSINELTKLLQELADQTGVSRL